VTGDALHNERDGMDFIGWMTRPLVDALYGVRGWSLREAVDHAGFGICPRILEVHMLVSLDRQIGIMRSVQLLRGYTDHVVMHVHKGCHDSTPLGWVPVMR
jgi:hypothetical protein